jgi:hypothetical protein
MERSSEPHSHAAMVRASAGARLANRLLFLTSLASLGLHGAEREEEAAASRHKAAVFVFLQDIFNCRSLFHKPGCIADQARDGAIASDAIDASRSTTFFVELSWNTDHGSLERQTRTFDHALRRAASHQVRKTRPSSVYHTPSYPTELLHAPFIAPLIRRDEWVSAEPITVRDVNGRRQSQSLPPSNHVARSPSSRHARRRPALPSPPPEPHG